MTPYWLTSTVEAFWAGAGEMEPYPRRLEQAVSWALPLAIVKVPRLCMKDVAARLAASGVDFRLHTPQRELHGCLVAFGGRGLVMLDGTDSTDEMRFSLAHEVGHFLIDYYQPRERAVRRLGDGVIDVLDGLRAPTVAERIDAILNEVDVGVHMHLMDRSTSGEIGCGRVAGAEHRADRLAFELLAPEHEVRRSASGIGGGDMVGTLNRLKIVLTTRFGLPSSAAVAYADFLVAAVRHQPTVKEWLGMGSPSQPRGRPREMSNLQVPPRKPIGESQLEGNDE